MKSVWHDRQVAKPKAFEAEDGRDAVVTVGNRFGDVLTAAPLQVAAMQPSPFQDAVDQFLRQKFRHVYEQREHLCEAWIAETGLLPSESVLCTQDVVGQDGTVVTRCWIERKRV